jgi:hypothetical protein
MLVIASGETARKRRVGAADTHVWVLKNSANFASPSHLLLLQVRGEEFTRKSAGSPLQKICRPGRIAVRGGEAPCRDPDIFPLPNKKLGKYVLKFVVNTDILVKCPL